MNEIEIKIDFTKGTLATKGIALITGDYASTMLKFTFDRQDGTKIFEMKNPSDEVVYVGEIINGEVLLTSKVDVTTIHNNKTYTKYTKDDAIYWYQPTDNKLFNDEWVEVSTFNLEEYTKVQVNASLFSESGKYIFEVSLYKDDTKLTSTKGILPVKQEQVIVGDEIVEAYIPIFDELIQEINEKITEANNLDLDVTDTSGVVEATLTKKDGTTKTVEIIDRNDYYDKDEVDAIQTTIEAEIPTKVSELDNDSNFIDNTVNDLTNYTKTSDLGAVALSNDYDDLTDKPNLSIYSLITETGNKIDLEINSSTYVLTAKLYDKNNNLISTSTGIDLPLETMVVGASYDSATKEIILTLKNGQEVRFSVADLVSGLQTEITSDNMLSSDLVDDTNHTHKFVSSSDITNWNNKSDFSGSYNDLTNKPDLTLKEDKSNKVTSLSNTSTDTQYPSAKCVYDSQVSQDTQIEQLQEENTYLNSIIDQLPRVSSTGDTITLNNTIEAKMKCKLSPSEMEQETTTGKNKFKTGTLETETTNNVTFTPIYENGMLQYIDVNGQATSNAYYNFTDSVTLSAGTYKLSGCPSGGNSSTTFALSLYTTRDYGTENTFTISEETTYTPNYIVVFNGYNAQHLKFYPMVRLSTESDTYEPYTNGASPNPQYPQDIHTTTGDNVIRVGNRNIYIIGQTSDYTGSGLDFLEINNNSISCKIDSGAATYGIKNTKYNINKFYIGANYDRSGQTPRFLVRAFDSNGAQITSAISGWTYNSYYNGYYKDENGTFDLSSASYVQVGFCWKGTQNEIGTYSNIILTTSSDTSYVEHQEQTYPLTLGTLEYSKIGNYEDEFIYNTTDTNLQLNKWYLKKNIDKWIIDGDTLAINSKSGTTSNNLFLTNGITNILKPVNNSTTANIYSTHFVKKSIDAIYTTNIYGIGVRNGGEIGIGMTLENPNNTIELINTWLQSNNVILYSPLATPTYTLLNDTLQTQLTNIYNNMVSKKGQTNLSQVNDDLPMVITASALLDLNTLVQ